MCLHVEKIYRQGEYKETTASGRKGDSYAVDAWKKCGHCIECTNEKANNWLVRNYYESKRHKKKCFITLTYAKNPIILVKKDLQDFIKRLRFHLAKENIQIRYFGCGEYGTKKGRPHYHLIIYGWEDNNAKFIEWNDKGFAVFQSEIIQQTWGHGRTSYQDFANEQIGYVALYVTSNHNSYLPKLKIDELKKQIKETKNRQTIQYLERRLKELEQKKQQYYSVKEFCVWSIGLGFDEFIKENKGEVWIEYINDKEFITPSPWVKKLANEGDFYAYNEMQKRKNFEKDRAETVDGRKAFKENKAKENDAKTIIDWQRKKQITEDF